MKSNRILKTLEKTIQKTSKKINDSQKNVDSNELLAISKLIKSYTSLRREIRLEEATPQSVNDKPEGYGDGNYVDKMYGGKGG